MYFSKSLVCQIAYTIAIKQVLVYHISLYTHKKKYNFNKMC